MTRAICPPALQHSPVIRPGLPCALSLHPLLALAVTVAGALACSTDFPNQPDSALTLQPVAWPSELHVSDVDTIEIQVRLRDSPQTVTGLRVQWLSSNDEVLRVVQLRAPEGGSREDTLVAQRRAEVTARAGGGDTVHIAVSAAGCFEPAESTFIVQ